MPSHITDFLSNILLPSLAPSTSPYHEQCTLYMAPSTIPNAGIGVFTAIDVKEGEQIGYPDAAIPVTDLDWHNRGTRDVDYHWLWANYDWQAASIGNMDHESHETVACVPGVGAMPNCHFRLENVRESFAKYDTAGLHRSKDAGVGAFTGYFGRENIAMRDLRGGSEIFVNYGEHWFTMRESTLGLVPMAESYGYAEYVLGQFHSLDFNGDDDAKSDLWELIHSFSYKSRGLAALPKSIELSNRAIEVGIKETELEASIRPVEWLRDNGKCLDNLKPGISTIMGAGRGAFATRLILEGDIVAPAPLIHIPHREAILLYGEIEGETSPEGGAIRNPDDVRGKQLLLNYCFGHSKSTLLLCPYASGTLFVNHNHQTPNVKIVWTDESKAMIHNATWLSQSIDFIEDQSSPGLEFDYVALRDIQPGEEVFLDYGKEWDDAWKSHMRDWKPVENAASYIDASQLNCYNDEECKNTPVLRTYEEQLQDPYPENLWMFCHFNYADGRNMVWNDETDEWRSWGKFNGNNPHKYPCLPLSRNDKSRRYSMELTVPVHNEHLMHVHDIHVEVKNMPQWAIQVVNVQYSSDMHLPNAFRHEMMIPDGIFPESWMNLN